MSTNCTAWQNNASCDSMVCNTDWTRTDTAAAVRNGFCRQLTGSFASCGTTCGTTKWGSDCCSTNDWSSCFQSLAKKGCANGGSSGVTGTHALGSTSIILTISGHALVATSTGSVTLTATSGAQVTGSATSSSSPAASSHSSAEKSISLGSKLTVYILVTGILANILC